MNLHSNMMVLASHVQHGGRRVQRSLLLAMSLMFLHVPNVFAQQAAASIHSMEAADAALAEVALARADIEARFAAEEQACHPKFFTTSCIDRAKDRRRQALMPLRKRELEAEQYKRQERLIERDHAAAGRRVKEEEHRLERIRPLRETESSEVLPQPEPEVARDAPVPVMRDRAAEHEARQRRRQVQEAANTGKRAENVAKYEQKVRAAQERQKQIAQKKAAKKSAAQPEQSASPPATH